MSAVHPLAPESLAAVAIYRAPIDLDAAVARLGSLWSENVDPSWVSVDSATDVPSNKILTFRLQGVQVMLTPVSGQLVLQRGQLPDHAFYVAMSFYAPLAGQADGTLAGEREMTGDNSTELTRRHRMMSALIVYTMLADALLREEAAIGVYRDELGVIHPPQMVEQLAQSLTQGQIPLPLWIDIRVGQGETNRGRTFGMPMFGHLDLEVEDSAQPIEKIMDVLGTIANYVVSGDEFLLPSQTLGFSDDEQFSLSLEVSPADGAPVIRVGY